MARGIDTAAHKGALAGGGDTVAVLGCGVDVVYPSENRKLAAEIAAKGLILSEFPMGATAFPQNFPDPQPDHQRDERRGAGGGGRAVQRIGDHRQAGASTRAARCSPSRATSRRRLSWGPNLLIKQGAKLVQDWNDVVAELPPEARRQLIEEGRRRLLGGAAATSGGAQASLLDDRPAAGEAAAPGALEALQVDAAIHLDDLLEKLEDTSPSELIAALFELEMLGLVKQLPGKNFVKVW